MQGPGGGLNHRPDIELRNFDGPRSYTLLDIKTFDAAGATHVASQHTDASRSAAHTSIASHCVGTEYSALPPRMRLIPLTVSTHGAFGPEATRFLSDLGKRSGGGVPVSLLDSATWAVPRFAPFIRMAVAHAVRRPQWAVSAKSLGRDRVDVGAPCYFLRRFGRHGGAPSAPLRALL